MSHKVYIKRKKVRNELPAFLDNGIKKLGSYANGPGVGYGALTWPELKNYMPLVLGIENTDIQFRKAVEQYFVDIEISVPLSGIMLEIGKDGETPINVVDYVKYYFAIAHPLVAEGEAAGYADTRKQYYTLDPKLAREREKTEKSELREALAFIIGAQDSNVLKYTLLVCGQPITNLVDLDDFKDSAQNFVERSSRNREEFMSVVNIPDLAIRAWARSAVLKGVLKETGGVYLYRNTNLGSIDNFIAFWKDGATNGEQIAIMKEEYRQTSYSRSPALVR